MLIKSQLSFSLNSCSLYSMAYPFGEIEKKWQTHWADNKTFRAENRSSKPKYYALDMFPYPSGAGLHVGHPLGYIASDIVSRYKRLKGFNVLHPMGYDSFGLPAEQYAIQTGQHPDKTTKENIDRYRSQMDKIGFSFDWDREVRTSDPNYYKWTQWIFLKLFNSWYNPETDKAEPVETLIPKLKNYSSLSEKEKADLLMNYRLAYLSEAWVNWCPQLGTVLANEEVKDGVSERGGYPVERKLMPQWSLRITAYAERLLNDLEKIDWSESIKESQRNWIGKSEGSSLRFKIAPHPHSLSEGEGSEDDTPQYQTAKKEIWGTLKENSRENRQKPTEAEEILWERLRNNQLGHKIRRQHAIDQFVADFICISKKIIIEVDGKIHANQNAYDKERTAMLAERGYKVIRFTNKQVLEKIDWVCEEIKKVLDNSPSPLEKGLGDEAYIEVFTTRPDTVFGVTFLTLAPESDLVSQLTTPEQKQKVDAYVHYAKNRSERERQADVKKVTGEFTGSYCIHPFTGKQIPIWIGEYVLAGYGTGAVMGVPAHDTRDYAFAKHFGLEIKKVIQSNTPSTSEKGAWDEAECFDTYDGFAINSDFIDNLQVKDAIKKIISEIEKRGLGKGKTQYRLRDAIFGRQRYWGEPIPIYYNNGIPKAMKEEHLPLILPEIDKYLPTETGEPPLARAKNWFYHPDKGMCSPSPSERGVGGEAELTTMPGWAGSSWYYLRYMDAHNDKEFAGKEAINYWREVDLYIGGSEHATGHLLYVRFWTKFLHDCGYLPIVEPAKKLINQGMIQGLSAYVYMLQVPKRLNKPIDIHFPQVCLSSNLAEKIIKTRSKREIIELLQQLNPSKDFKGFDFEFSETSESGFYKIPVHINRVFGNDEIDFEELCSSDPRFKIATPLKEQGKFFVSREVEKMSKSKYNVVCPDDTIDEFTGKKIPGVIEQFGTDTLRMYEMFLGPLEMSKPWNTNGISGVFNFLNRFWRLFHKENPTKNPEEKLKKPESWEVSEEEPTKQELKILHKTIKKIQQDIENYSFNTAVSAFMICTNELMELKCSKRAVLEPLVVLLSPFAPHIAEELWNKLGHKESVTFALFPQYNDALTVDDSFAYPVSFNGKMRFNIELSLSLSPAEIEKEVLAFEQTKKYLEGKQPKKIIVVPKRIVNIVV